MCNQLENRKFPKLQFTPSALIVLIYIHHQGKSLHEGIKKFKQAVHKNIMGNTNMQMY